MNLPTPDPIAYAAGKPFPHTIVDGFLNKYDLQKILLEWPEKLSGYNENHKKGFTNLEPEMGVVISAMIKIVFQSQKFINWLEQLTGIKGLVLPCNDPSLHETFPGGSLTPHLDYTIHPSGLQHRVNAILFLNENWSHGGNLELYESHRMHGGCLTRLAVSIEPIFNRIAIFNIDERAWHGTGEVKGDRSRKSIAINYFSAPEKNAVKIPTTFSNEKRNLKRFLKQFIPPILLPKNG